MKGLIMSAPRSCKAFQRVRTSDLSSSACESGFIIRVFCVLYGGVSVGFVVVC